MINKIGIFRPGATQMLVSVVLATAAGLIPAIIAAITPTHECSVLLSGYPALGVLLVSLAIVVFYCLGFFRYCASKGYSKWLAVCLLLSSFPGFVALLLLPDLKEKFVAESGNLSKSEVAFT